MRLGWPYHRIGPDSKEKDGYAFWRYRVIINDTLEQGRSMTSQAWLRQLLRLYLSYAPAQIAPQFY